MNHDVFISHSSKNKVMADAICHTLEQNGIKCWIAPRDVRPGFEYAEELIRGIENCKVFLLVFSKESNSSGPVSKEVESAFRYNKIVMPYRIEDVQMSKSFEYYLSNLHWLDAYPDDREFAKLTTALKGTLGMSTESPIQTVPPKPTPQPVVRPVNSAQTSTQTPTQEPPQKKKPRVGLIIGIIIGVLVILTLPIVLVLSTFGTLCTIGLCFMDDPNPPPPPPPPPQITDAPTQPHTAPEAQLHGRWQCTDDSEHFYFCTWIFSAGKRFADGDGDEGSYRVDGNLLYLRYDCYDGEDYVEFALWGEQMSFTLYDEEDGNTVLYFERVS